MMPLNSGSNFISFLNLSIFTPRSASALVVPVLIAFNSSVVACWSSQAFLMLQLNHRVSDPVSSEFQRWHQPAIKPIWKINEQSKVNLFFLRRFWLFAAQDLAKRSARISDCATSPSIMCWCRVSSVSVVPESASFGRFFIVSICKRTQSLAQHVFSRPISGRVRKRERERHQRKFARSETYISLRNRIGFHLLTSS